MRGSATGERRKPYREPTGIYPVGSYGRLIVALAIRTGITPKDLEQEDESVIATMVDILTDRNDDPTGEVGEDGVTDEQRAALLGS